MTGEELRAMLGSLKDYYGLEGKLFSPGRLAQWAAKVDSIPSAAVDYIRAAIEDNNDTLPRNIPKWCRTYYHKWAAEQAAHVVQQRTQCDYCRGEGLLFVRRPAMINGEQITGRGGVKLMESCCYRCAACDNWRRHVGELAMEAATPYELAEKGWEVKR